MGLAEGARVSLELFAKIKLAHVSLLASNLGKKMSTNLGAIQNVINQWLKQYNHIRPHHALGMRPPIPETILVNHQISVT